MSKKNNIGLIIFIIFYVIAKGLDAANQSNLILVNLDLDF